eukprot:m.8776 g.8776  ORF g.8776 m.8776 type:complete len:365 (+) comp5395_c0_seq2:364-1458(+)
MASAAETPQAPEHELVQFLSMSARPDVRGTAGEIVLGLTASQEKESFFKQNLALVKAVITIAKEEPLALVRRDAYASLINLASVESLAKLMVQDEMIEATCARILDQTEEYPDQPCMLLGNITRFEFASERLVDHVVDDMPVLYRLVNVFCRSKAHNERGTFDFLANGFFNITQTNAGRDMMMARSAHGCVFQRLLPFTEYQDSQERRGAIVGAIRNCCFSTKDHDWLLSDDVNLLPSLLLPLAGPEELDDDDMDGLPDDLQFLPPDKEREEDADIRKLLLESLHQLCATRPGRDLLRARKVYPILRELHKWEPEEDVKEACEQVVEILIMDETQVDDNVKEPMLEELSLDADETDAQAADGSQ